MYASFSLSSLLKENKTSLGMENLYLKLKGKLAWILLTLIVLSPQLSLRANRWKLILHDLNFINWNCQELLYKGYINFAGSNYWIPGTIRVPVRLKRTNRLGTKLAQNHLDRLGGVGERQLRFQAESFLFLFLPGWLAGWLTYNLLILWAIMV